MEKIITVHGKDYKTVSDGELGACEGCFVNKQNELSCWEFTDQVGGNCNGVVFHEVTEVSLAKPLSTRPSISLSFDLDLSTVSLPEVFKVKSLRLSTLDAALVKGTDAFTLSIKDVPQDTVEVIAQSLAAEFLRRYSKEIK